VRFSLPAFVVLTGLFSTAIHGVRAAEPVLEARVVLYRAAALQGLPDENAGAMLVDLQRVGDRWERGFAAAAGFGNTERDVRVDAGEVAADTMRFVLAVSPPGPEARYHYRVTLKKESDGRFAGTYTGKFRGADIQGPAEAAIKPARQMAAGYVPLQPGEHPRLLFRKADMPALRKKAETPFGKLALEKLPDSAAGLALRYQLTGDATFAATARQRVEAAMADIEKGDKRVRSRWYGLRLEQVALAYDMCYDAWPLEFRQQVAEHLLARINTFYNQRNSSAFDDHISWTLSGSHGPPILFGGGLAGLAIYGEKGEKPGKAGMPHVVRIPDGVVEPDKNDQPGKEIAAGDFKSGAMLMNWIYAGPVPQAADPLAEAAVRAGLRPVVGTAVSAGEKKFEFQAITSGKGYYDGEITGGKLSVEITGPGGPVSFTTGYFFTVLRNEAERWVRFDTDHYGVEGYLAGTRIAPGETVRLKPGIYPLLIPTPVGNINPWGKVFMRPRFTELTDAEAKEAIAAAREDVAQNEKDRAFDTAQWERTGGCDARYIRAYEITRFTLGIVFGETPGAGGLALSGEDMLTLDGPNKYAFAHRIAMGRDVTPYADIAAVLPYKMFVHTYRADGKALGQEGNGPAGFNSTSYPENSRSTLTDNFATLFPLVRDEWKPAVLWAWRRHTGADADPSKGEAAILTTGARSGYAYSRPYGTFDTEPIYAFVNYPVDPAGSAAGMRPVPPQGVMPLTWAAPGGGFYGFRNNWGGNDDEVITHFYGHTKGGGAGTFRLVGLGAVWSHGLTPTPAARFGENVVQIPDQVINENARGRVTFHEGLPDGSGALTVNLDDVYSAPRIDENDRAMALYEKYGALRRPAAFRDQGIRGFRAMGVDYSGKSGAPCLLVLVDSIKGGGGKLWTWQIESKTENGPPTTRVNTDDIVFDGKQFKYKVGQLLKTDMRRIEDDPMFRQAGNAFTLKQGEATLTATFVTPAAVKMALAERVEYRQGFKSGVTRNSSKAVFAEGGDDFFVIVTLQRGAAPAVSVTGEGLAGKVKVGGQTVSFAGQRVVFGR
jgi:hypothetical protein